MKKYTFFLFLLVGCSNPYQDLHDSLNETLSIIDGFYPEKPSVEKLRQGMLNGLIQAADSHGSYLSSDQLKSLVESVDGGKFKLGIILAKHKEGFIVRKVYEESAGHISGIKENDILTKFDEKPLKNMPLNDFPNIIKEEKAYQITLLREKKHLTKTITPKPFVASSTELKWFENIAYLKFGCITKEAAQEVEKQLKKIQAQPRRAGLILDLRDCPGGSFEAGIGIASQFLDGHVIVEMQKKKDFSKFSSASFDALNKLPIVILQNQSTCSAAEIIAAALKAHKRAILIGTNTAGSATAKDIFHFSNRDDGFIISIAFLNDPFGKRISNTGVEPHIKIESVTLPKPQQKDVFIQKALTVLKKGLNQFY